jgi:uncharacterized tellurite resistance protein B-like protein
MRNLKRWIAKRLGEDEDVDVDDVAGLNLAVAALLVEVLRADYATQPAEQRQAVEGIGRQLGLGEADCRDLLELATRTVEESSDLYQFTSLVNRGCTADEKLRLVEQLWRVAMADEVVHKYEEHMIRRIADLLHVPHRAFIAAKLRAESAAR